jgi:hypothetical protein
MKFNSKARKGKSGKQISQKATEDTKAEWLNRRKGRRFDDSTELVECPKLNRTVTEVKGTCSRWQGIV